jgi:hypothetical protein
MPLISNNRHKCNNQLNVTTVSAQAREVRSNSRCGNRTWVTSVAPWLYCCGQLSSCYWSSHAVMWVRNRRSSGAMKYDSGQAQSFQAEAGCRQNRCRGLTGHHG